MTIELIFAIVVILLSIAWWVWFAQKLNGIHAETKRTADALDAMNLRELRKESAEREAKRIALAEAGAEPSTDMQAESERIREQTRRRAGL